LARSEQKMQPKQPWLKSMNNSSLHISKFNDKVRVMNQTSSQNLIFSAQEARNLHAEIFELLAQIAENQIIPNKASTDVVTVQMDGGNFK